MSDKLEPGEFWNLMDEYARAFGWVVMHWTRLEHNMMVLVEKLTGTDRTTAEAIYLPLRANARSQLIAALAKANIPEKHLQDRVLEFVTQFDSVRIQRNHLMHSPIAWVSDADSTMRQRRESQYGQVKKALAEVPLSDVRSLGATINGLGHKVLGEICFHKDFAARFEALRTQIRS